MSSRIPVFKFRAVEVYNALPRSAGFRSSFLATNHLPFSYRRSAALSHRADHARSGSQEAEGFLSAPSVRVADNSGVMAISASQYRSVRVGAGQLSVIPSFVGALRRRKFRWLRSLLLGGKSSRQRESPLNSLPYRSDQAPAI